MAKTIGNLRGYVRRLDEKLGDPPAKARAKIRSIEVKRINLVSTCRSILDRHDLPLASKQEQWINLMVDYTYRVRNARDDALEDLKESHTEAETLLLQLSKFSAHRPEPDKWPEYQALSPDIRNDIEDVAEGSPSEIVAMYTEAHRIGDSVTCFAIERFGSKAILAAQAKVGGASSDHIRYSRALKELDDLISESSPERVALELKVKSIQKDITVAERIFKGQIEVKQFPGGEDLPRDPDAKYLKGVTLSSDEIALREKYGLDKHGGLSALDLECGLGWISMGEGHLRIQAEDDTLHNRIPPRITTENILPSGSVTRKVESRVREREEKGRGE